MDGHKVYRNPYNRRSRRTGMANRRRRVVLYFSQWGTPMYTHEKVTLATVAETIAELIGYEFDGEYDPVRHASGNIYFVPDDTLMQDEALHLGIRSATALYGGVVPYPFVKTKVITHDLVSPTAAKPKGPTSLRILRATSYYQVIPYLMPMMRALPQACSPTS